MKKIILTSTILILLFGCTTKEKEIYPPFEYGLGYEDRNQDGGLNSLLEFSSETEVSIGAIDGKFDMHYVQIAEDMYFIFGANEFSGETIYYVARCSDDGREIMLSKELSSHEDIENTTWTTYYLPNPEE